MNNIGGTYLIFLVACSNALPNAARSYHILIALVAPLWSLCRTLCVLIASVATSRLYIHRQHALINDRLITVHQDIHMFALHRERERHRNINEFTKQWIIWLH